MERERERKREKARGRDTDPFLRSSSRPFLPLICVFGWKRGKKEILKNQLYPLFVILSFSLSLSLSLSLSFIVLHTTNPFQTCWQVNKVKERYFREGHRKKEGE
jgi:hypothetical protein